MPIPLIPILAIAGLGGGILYYVHTRRAVEDEGQPALQSEELVFSDRGHVVRVREVPGGWRWTASREGHKPRSGMAPSKNGAISSALKWVSSRSLPAAKVIRQLPAPKKPPRRPQSGGEGDSPKTPPPSPESGSTPVAPPAPPAPEPTEPTGPTVPVEPPRPPAPTPPAPVGTGATPPGPASGIAHARGLVRSGLRLQGNTLVLTDLQDYVADAYGSFDPFTDEPAAVVTKMLQGLLPELGVVDARELKLRLLNDAGEKIWVADAIEQVGRLQHQLLAPGLNPELVPFASDILAEGIFDTEQRISGEEFSYRGRKIFARPFGGGFRWSIRDAAGVHGPSEQVFPTPEASNRDAIEAISNVDAVAA